jgi:signal transduction histidine kinase
MGANDTLHQIDELRADELPALQQELLGEFIQFISRTLAVTRMSPETLSTWRDMLARMRQTLENSELEKSNPEYTSSPVLEDVKDASETSRAIGIAQIPDDVLQALRSNRHLRSASQMSIIVFDKPWKEDAPTYATVVAKWHSNPKQMSLAGTRLPFEDSDKLNSLLACDTPLVIEDIRQDKRAEQSLVGLIDQGCAVGFIIYPLVAGGQWYGLFIAQYDKVVSQDVVSHIRGLLDQAALAVYTMLLFEAEARARQTAEQANNQKMKLLATISHEMRTPLTSIKGFATTLLADDVEWSPDSQRDFVETINQEADKLSELIEHLLSHSRLEAGTLPIKPKEKHVQDIISLAMAQLQTLAVNHILKIHIPADLPSIYADQRRIAQVLTNLVKNAVEYSPYQSIIEITVSLQDTHVEFDVSDQGLGIQPEEHVQVFEAFHRGARAKEIQRKGTGLGLAICKGIIEAHHGKIWVQDRLEPGTTISFTLPTFDAHTEKTHSVLKS